ARAAAAAGDIHLYPDPDATALREAIAERYDVPFDRIVAGAGASDLLERALRVLVRRGESVVANAPSWPLFPELCRRLGIVVHRSFSKLHGLAALRVGYAIAAPPLAERLANAGVPFAVSTIAQAAARAALADDEHAMRVRAEAREIRARAGPRAFASDAPFF